MSLLKNILYICGGITTEDASLKRAVQLAENNQAKLTVTAVVPVMTSAISLLHGSSTVSQLQGSIVTEAREKLETLVEPYKNKIHIEVQVLEGTLFIEAIKDILRNSYDLLIKPVENPSFISRIFGSDDMQLLRNCPCPVWLMRTDETSKYKRVLATIDVDPDTSDETEQGLNKQILELAGSLTVSHFSELHVLHVWDAPSETMLQTWSEAPETYVEEVRLSHKKAYDKVQEECLQWLGRDTTDYISPQFYMRQGIAATTIPEVAEELSADLVVMGTVARTGVAGFLIGNTAEAIIEQLQCSVLAIKPPGFVSPVKLS